VIRIKEIVDNRSIDNKGEPDILVARSTGQANNVGTAEATVRPRSHQALLWLGIAGIHFGVIDEPRQQIHAEHGRVVCEGPSQFNDVFHL
jgi:hypothetical protein